MSKSFPLYYETCGNPGNPCIVLITGIGGQLTDWPLLLTQGLADNGFYVVTFDNRDSGLSRHYDELGMPNLGEAMAAAQEGKSFKPPYSLEDMAGDVIALMDELHIEKAHILGVSMGGIIAQYVALNHGNRVNSLICIATTSGDPGLPPAKKEVLESFASSMNAESQSMESSINNKLRLFRIYNHPDSFDEDKIRNELINSYKRANYPAGFKRLVLAMICAKPRTDKLKKLRVPCLVIHGDYDPVFSVEHGKQLAEIIPGSHLEIIEKMGHGIPDFACNKIVALIVTAENQFMNTQKNKEAVIKLLDEVWSKGSLEIVDQLIAPQYEIKQDPGDQWEGKTLDLAAYKERVRQSRSVFPDQTFYIDDILAEDDKVSVSWHFTGTQNGNIPGLPTTNKKVTVSGSTIYYFTNGMISGHWQIVDRLGFIGQLGIKK